MGQQMHEIVHRSTHLTEFDKETLCMLFEHLQDNQEELFGKISDNVKKQMQRMGEENREWEIVTALIEKTDAELAKKNGLYEVCRITPFCRDITYDRLADGQENRGNVYSAGIAFLKCPYPDMVSLTRRQYLAHIVSKAGEFDVAYRLEPYSVYYRYEELLERTARQYGVTGPVLFSPLARRAVNVKVDLGENEISKSDNARLDFRLEQNGLSDIIQENKTLVWNVEVTDRHEIPRPKENVEKKVVPLFEKTYLLYEFPTRKDEYIYVEAETGDVKRYGSSVYLNLHDGYGIDSARYWKLVRHGYTKNFLEDVPDKFFNFYVIDRMNKERIRTEADMDYVLGRFLNGAAKYAGISRSIGNARAVRVYESKDAYHYSKNKIFRSSAVCYVRFEQSDPLLFEDTVSYIMAYMNYYYPEFYWVGVV